jgi:hypothetical protein
MSRVARERIGERIAQAGVFLTDKVRGPGVQVDDVRSDSVVVQIPMVFGKRRDGLFVVRWEAEGSGFAVRSEIVESLVSQSKLLGVIPLGRGRVLALKPYVRSVAHFKAALEDRSQ